MTDTPTRLSIHGRTAIEVAVTGLLAFASSLFVFLPILRDLNVPWGGGDMTVAYLMADEWDWWRFGVAEHYDYPFGMNIDLSTGVDIVPNTVAHLITLVTGSPFTGINLMLVLSFPAVAMLAYSAIRLVGLSGPLAVTLANAFTFIPYHFGRGLGHVFLATLVGAVTGIILALMVGSGRIQSAMSGEHGRRRWAWIGVMTALVVVTAWSGIYYAVFTALLLLALIPWRIGRGDSWRRVLMGSVPLIGIGVLVAIGLLPGLLARASEAFATSATLRDSIDSVTYAGNLAVALLPEPYSLLMPAYNEYVLGLFAGATQSEPVLMYSFGSWVTTAALLAMIVGIVRRYRRLSLAGRERRAAGDSPDSWLPLLTYLIAAALVFFVPWSLNYLFADLVTAQIRGWNRLVPVLLLLFVLGAAATFASTRWARASAAAWVVSGVIVVVTVVEMILPWRNIYALVSSQGRIELAAAEAYARDVNTALPDRCGVLTLPLMLYPNNGPVMPIMDDYDHFVIGLTNPGKPLSYGAVRDTEASAWQLALTGPPTPEQVRDLRMRGYCAVHLDTGGYLDPAPISAQLTSQFGAPVAVSPDGRWQMYALA